MARAQQLKVTGLHIFNDDKGRTVFYNIFDKKAYIINGEDDIKKYNIFQTRLPLAIIVGFAVSSFLNQTILGIVLAVLLYVIMSLFFYLHYIKGLAISKGFVKPKMGNPILHFVEPLSNNRIIIGTIMALALGVLLIVNVQISNFDNVTNIFNYILAVAAFALALALIIGYFMKNKKQ